MQRCEIYLGTMCPHAVATKRLKEKLMIAPDTNRGVCSNEREAMPSSLSKFRVRFSDWHKSLTPAGEMRRYKAVLPTQGCFFYFKPSPGEQDRFYAWIHNRKKLKSSGIFHQVVLCGAMYDAARHAGLIACHVCEQTTCACKPLVVESFPAASHYKCLFTDFARFVDVEPTLRFECHDDCFGSGRNVIQSLIGEVQQALLDCVPDRLRLQLEDEYPEPDGGLLRFIFRTENSYYWWRTVTEGLLRAVERLHAEPYAKHECTLYNSNVLLEYALQIAARDDAITMERYLDELRTRKLDFFASQVMALFDQLALVLDRQGMIDFVRDLSHGVALGNDRAYWTILRPAVRADHVKFCSGTVVGLHADGVGFPTRDAMAIGVISSEPDTVGPYRYQRTKHDDTCVRIAFVGEVDVCMDEELVQDILRKGKEVFLCCRNGEVAVWDPSGPPEENLWVFGMTRFTLPSTERYVDRLPVMISHQMQCKWIKTSIKNLNIRLTAVESGMMYLKSGLGTVASQLRGMLLAMCGLGFLHIGTIVAAVVIVIISRNTVFGGISIHKDHIHYQGVYVDQQPYVRTNITSFLTKPPDHSTRCACLYGPSGTGKSQMGTNIAHDADLTKRFIGGIFDIKCPVYYDKVEFLKLIHRNLFPSTVLGKTKESFPAEKLEPFLKGRIESTFVEERHWFYEKLSNLSLVSGPARPILVIANNITKDEHVDTLHSLLRKEDSLLVTSQEHVAGSYCKGFKLNILQKKESKRFLKSYVGKEKFKRFSHASLLVKADGLAMNLAIIAKQVLFDDMSWDEVEDRYIEPSDIADDMSIANFTGGQDSVFSMIDTTIEGFNASGDSYMRSLVKKFDDLASIPAGTTNVKVLQEMWGEDYRAVVADLSSYGLIEYSDSTGAEVFIHDHIGQYVRGRAHRLQTSTDKVGKQLQPEAQHASEVVGETTEKKRQRWKSKSKVISEKTKRRIKRAFSRRTKAV